MKFSFKNLFIPSGEKTELVAYRAWEVRWFSIIGRSYGTVYGYSFSYKENVELFPSEPDAYAFARQLREANKLIGNDGDIIKITVKETNNKLATV